jgi:hypothetical protein
MTTYNAAYESINEKPCEVADVMRLLALLPPDGSVFAAAAGVAMSSMPRLSPSERVTEVRQYLQLVLNAHITANKIVVPLPPWVAATAIIASPTAFKLAEGARTVCRGVLRGRGGDVGDTVPDDILSILGLTARPKSPKDASPATATATPDVNGVVDATRQMSRRVPHSDSTYAELCCVYGTLLRSDAPKQLLKKYRKTHKPRFAELNTLLKRAGDKTGLQPAVVGFLLGALHTIAGQEPAHEQ